MQELFLIYFLIFVGSWGNIDEHKTHYVVEQEVTIHIEEPTDNDRILQDLSRKHGVNYAYVKSVIKVESDNDPYTRPSHKGAYGWMQVTPIAAKDVSKYYNVDCDKFKTSKEVNAECGILYISLCKKKLKIKTINSSNSHWISTCYIGGWPKAVRHKKSNVLPSYARTYARKVNQHFIQ